MALKRRNKAEASFSMSSMTDIIFLLLIFFMLTSSVVHPNAIKLMLPQSNSQTAASQKAKFLGRHGQHAQLLNILPDRRQ